VTEAPERPAGDNANLAQRILDAALDLGEQRGWDAVHLHDIAQTLEIELADIGRHYDQKDAIAEAWFDRADAALLLGAALAQAPTPGASRPRAGTGVQPGATASRSCPADCGTSPACR